MQNKKTKSEFISIPSLFGKYEEIPIDWEYLILGDNYDFVKGKVPNSLDRIPSKNSTPYLSTDYLDRGIEQFTIDPDIVKVNESDVIIIGDGSGSGRAYTNVKGALSSTFILLKAKNLKIHSKFLYYYLKSKHVLLENTRFGTSIPHVDKNVLKKLVVPNPSSTEQQKIISILSNIDLLINQTKYITEQTKKIKKGLTQKLLTKGLQHTDCRDVDWLFGNTISIPQTWTRPQIKDLVIKNNGIKTGPFGSSLLEKELVSYGVRVLFPENIEDGKISNQNAKYITQEKFQDLKEFEVFENDIVISLMGTIGKSGLVTKEVGKAIISKHLLKITLNPNICSPEFLLQLFNSQLIQSQINSVSQGLTMQGLNTKIIKNLLCILPPIIEQQKIISILSNIDLKLRVEQKYKSIIESLQNGLLQQLLTGKLRVKI